MNLAAHEQDYLSLFDQEENSRELYLGPALVINTNGRLILLGLPEDEVWAFNAVSFPYSPHVGDKVLAIGREGSFYVIGVLAATGKTTFTAPGDLEFRAPRGKIDLVSSEGLNIRTSEMKVVSNHIEYVARSIVEKYENAKCWVRQAFHLRAGSARTVVESTYKLRAERIVEKAKGEVKIDGDKIHLG
jgi:hypothetical protein